MIPDPEHEPARWDEPIVANSPAEAQRECQQRAERYDVELESVTEPRRIEKRPQVYRCNFKEKD